MAAPSMGPELLWGALIYIGSLVTFFASRSALMRANRTEAASSGIAAVQQ